MAGFPFLTRLSDPSEGPPREPQMEEEPMKHTPNDHAADTPPTHGAHGTAGPHPGLLLATPSLANPGQCTALSVRRSPLDLLATEQESPENLYMLKWGADPFHFLPRYTQSGVGRTPGAGPVGNPHICKAGVGTELPGAPQRLLSPENFLTSFQCAHPWHLDLGRRLTSRLLPTA